MATMNFGYVARASDTLRISNDADFNDAGADWTPPSGGKIGLATITVVNPGTARMKFTLRSSNYGVSIVYGKIYKNGVAIGTERSTGEEATFSEDFTGLRAGDVLIVYGKGVFGFHITNTRLYYDTGTAAQA